MKKIEAVIQSVREDDVVDALCKMTFTEEIRLLRHYKKAHPSKSEQYKQKWYWDNPASP